MDWGGSFKFINYNESDFLSAGNVVEVVKKLPSIHVRPWVQSPGFHKTHLYTASQTGSKFQGPPRVHSQFKDIMDYVRPCLETNTNNIIFQHSLPIYFWSSILTSQQPGKEVMKEAGEKCLLSWPQSQHRRCWYFREMTSQEYRTADASKHRPSPLVPPTILFWSEDLGWPGDTVESSCGVHCLVCFSSNPALSQTGCNLGRLLFRLHVSYVWDRKVVSLSHGTVGRAGELGGLTRKRPEATECSYFTLLGVGAPLHVFSGHP